MLEIVGALAISAIAFVLIAWLIGMPWLALGFGGPSVSNFGWLFVGLVLATGIAVGWWHLVGTHIHVGFG
ncbi:membrane protein [Streptomyces phage Faust]|uniref:Membrane protein n=1 Tax=Streptomyces phage Faust TaxID=2767565 RepID=A0A7G9UYX0_9CAUD|nr:membrane protein [Streptomyces phage Faust]QNN99225.1 membrane protein [Streptomyces phage Faust]